MIARSIWQAIHAVYFTPMDFHRFPFDSQLLDMQFSFEAEINPAIKRFIPSASTTRFLIRGEGDTVSGWDVQSIEIVPKNISLQVEMDYFIETFGKVAVPSDPAPITGVPGREGYLGQAERVGFDIYIRIDRFWKVSERVSAWWLHQAVSFLHFAFQNVF